MAVFDVSASAPHLFAAPPGRPFFRTLVASILDDFGERPERLAKLRIFVPSRRAVRALKEAFVALSPSHAMLLPQISAIADLSEDDLLTHAVERQTVGLPAAPSAVAKRLVLAQTYREGREALGHGAPDWPAALRAAEELARTSDQLAEYRVDSAAFERLAEHPAIKEGAAHWRDISALLKSVTEAWPRWLNAHGLIDPRVRRSVLLNGLTERLQADQHAPLIVAAGFLGTTPSSQRFLHDIAKLQRGCVVLPALDTDLSDEAWEKIEAPHPQYAYKHLFESTFEGVPRSSVGILPSKDSQASVARRRLLSLALMPPQSTDAWTDLFRAFQQTDQSLDSLRGLEVAVAPTSEDEADWIAIRLREVLEKPKQTGALVTADRRLARRVAAKLRGWGIELDDSGGKPLSGSYRATFMRSIARLMDNPSDPVAWASMIHHQLFGMNKASAERKIDVQTFDRFLRGRPPRNGWAGLLASLDDDWRPFKAAPADKDRVASMIKETHAIFSDNDPGPGVPLTDRLLGHIKIAIALATTLDENGRDRLFRFEDGEALDSHFSTLLERPALMSAMRTETYTDVFDGLLAMAPAFRPPGGQHPRLSVYGILEARLQTADLLIIGGLQEGVWPGEETVDSFLSRAMRKELGLPSLDADIGRVAHDFFDFAAGPHVLLTRAERQGSLSARPSRFMVRLESFLKALDKDGKTWNAAPRLSRWADHRYATSEPPKPSPRPRPKPPVHLRPRRISVSMFERWMRDPYSVYAEKILKLRKFRPYADAFGYDSRGIILHSWAEETVRMLGDDDEQSPEDVMALLKPDILETYNVPLEQQLLNGSFISKMEQHFPSFHRQSMEHGIAVGLEIKGEVAFDINGEEVSIRGRADRIDKGRDGYHIMDYKLSDGSSIDPRRKEYSPQLYLLALMMLDDGFDLQNEPSLHQISFVPLKNEPKVFDPKKDFASLYARDASLKGALETFEVECKAWLTAQYNPDTTFASQVAPRNESVVGDYDQLARRLEWSSLGGDDG